MTPQQQIKEAKAKAEYWKSAATSWRQQMHDWQEKALKYQRFVAFAYGLAVPSMLVAGFAVGLVIGRGAC